MKNMRKKSKLYEKLTKNYTTNVAILLDTKGPEIRTGDFVGGKTELSKKVKFLLSV